MAILMLIGSDNVNEPYQYLDDIIGVFSDDHPFSEHELARFNFLTVNGSREDVSLRLNQLDPTVAEAFFSVANNRWQFSIVDPDSYSMSKLVWQYPGATPNKWYNLVNKFKFNCNTTSLTTEEKQSFETIDINHSSVDAAVRKLIKDFATDPANNIEEKDLRNQKTP